MRKKLVILLFTLFAGFLVACEQTALPQMNTSSSNFKLTENENSEVFCSVSSPAKIESNEWLFDLYDSFATYKAENVQQNGDNSSHDIIQTINVYIDENNQILVDFALLCDTKRIAPWCEKYITTSDNNNVSVCFGLLLQNKQEKYILVKELKINEINYDTLQPVFLYNRNLESQFKDAEPIQEISINNNKFPDLVADVFEKMILEENNTTSTTDTLSEITLQSVELWGDKNEFCVKYYFSGVCGANNPIIATADSFLDGRFYNAVKTIRVRKEESGEYAIIAQGGGPLAYGLEKVDINIKNLY